MGCDNKDEVTLIEDMLPQSMRSVVNLARYLWCRVIEYVRVHYIYISRPCSVKECIREEIEDTSPLAISDLHDEFMMLLDK